MTQTLNGFLLSRQWEDASQPELGLTLIFWLSTPQGPLRAVFTEQEAIAFVEHADLTRAIRILRNAFRTPDADKPHWHEKNLNLKSFAHKPVHGLYFREQRNLYRARDLLAEQHITLLEADIAPTDRFLMERFITGSVSIQGEFIQREGFLEAFNPRLKSADYTPQFSVLSLDIETSMRGNELYSIGWLATNTDPNTAQENEQRKVLMVQGLDSEVETRQCPDYLEFCVDEFELMQRFIHEFNEFDPDIVTGWNVINFDWRFLQDKANQLNLPLHLGRSRTPLQWRQSRGDNEHFTLMIPGRAVLDGIDTLKSATFSFESFALQYVASTLLGHGKLIHSNDHRGEEITRLFLTHKIELAAYNLEDCQLVWDIIVATDLINLAVERAQLTGLALDRYGGSVAAFNNRYLPRLHRAGFVSPNLPRNPQGVGSPGGYVMSSTPGIFDHVLVLDFKSLYPSIIRTFKVDPLGLALGDANGIARAGEDCRAIETPGVDMRQYVPGYSGARFSKQHNILPGIIEQLWEARDQAKLNENKAMSQAIKILMNSFYGVLGTPGCRFFDFRLPSSITLRGHTIMTQSKTWIEEQGHQVIYGDTDSVFVWLRGDFDKSAAGIRQLGKAMATLLNQRWNDLIREHYQLPSFLEIEFETHFKRFVMPTLRGSDTGSKKRYAGLQVSSFRKDHENLELVFKGLETVRTDWTPLARDFQHELYRRLFFDEPYKDFIKDTVDNVKAGEMDDQLVFRKRIRRRLDDYVRNVPPHVQAARIADRYRKAQGLAPIYHRGGWIQYVLTLNGAEPVEHVTATPDYELYIDRQIAPIVDGIVHFLGTSFKEITDKQITLFS